MTRTSRPSLKRIAAWLVGVLMFASAMALGFWAGATRATRIFGELARPGRPAGPSPSRWDLSGLWGPRTGGDGAGVATGREGPDTQEEAALDSGADATDRPP